MRFLFNGELAPLTNKFGFAKGNFEEAVDAFYNWSKPENGTLEYLETDFRTALMMLPPFHFYTRSLLFRTNSGWVGYVDNAAMGPDNGKANNIGRLLNSQAVNVVAEPKTIFSKSNTFNFCEYNYHDFLTGQFRSIYLHYDETWEFYIAGEPLPFEQLNRYTEKRKTDRFNPEILDQYCKAIGIDFFNEDFYLGGKGNLVLIKNNRDLYNNEEPRPFDEMRRKYLVNNTIPNQDDKEQDEDKEIEKLPFYLNDFLVEVKNTYEPFDTNDSVYQLQDSSQNKHFRILFQGDMHENRIGWQRDQPPKLIAESSSTKEQILLFDGMLHGYDACIAGFHIRSHRREEEVDLYEEETGNSLFEVFLHFDYDGEVIGDEKLLKEVMKVNKAWYQENGIKNTQQMASCGFTSITIAIRSTDGKYKIILQEETA